MKYLEHLSSRDVKDLEDYYSLWNDTIMRSPVLTQLVFVLPCQLMQIAPALLKKKIVHRILHQQGADIFFIQTYCVVLSVLLPD